jgi:hypothetical protein
LWRLIGRLFVNYMAKVKYQATIQIISDTFKQVMAANPHLEHISKLTKDTLQVMMSIEY